MSAYTSVATGNWDADSTWAAAWLADTVQALNSWRRPTVANGFIYECTARAGDFKTDPATEPVWPTTVGNTVVDDQVTWTCRDEYPNDVTAGHSWTITAGHTVKYNVSETVALGAGTVNGVLRFRTDMSTKMVGGDVHLITVSATGEVSGIDVSDVSQTTVGAAYTCEIYCLPTANAAKYVVDIGAGGKWSLYGSAAYYGSDPWTYLAVNDDNEDTDATMVTVDDMSAKWAANQEVCIHKKDDYGAYATDCEHRTIQSISGTTITFTVNHGAVDNNHQGIVIMLNRNLILGKYGATLTVAGTNGTMPMIRDQNTTVANADFRHAEIRGIYYCYLGYGNTYDGCIFRNGFSIFYSNYGPAAIGTIVVTSHQGVGTIVNSTISHIIAGPFSSQNVAIGLYNSTVLAGEFFDCYHLFTGHYSTLGPNVYAYCIMYCLGAANGFGGIGLRFRGVLGKNTFGAACPNDYDIIYSQYQYLIDSGDITIENADLPTITTYSRNKPTHTRKTILSHNDRSYDEHLVYQSLGSVSKVLADEGGAGDAQAPAVDKDGTASGVLIKINDLQTNLAVLSSVGVDACIDHKIWLADETTYTIKYYIQSSHTGTLAAGSLVLSAEYLSNNTTGATTVVSSTNTIAKRDNTSDWDQYVSVTFLTKQAGWVKLSMKFYVYESGKCIWIHPKPEVTS